MHLRFDVHQLVAFPLRRDRQEKQDQSVGALHAFQRQQLSHHHELLLRSKSLCPHVMTSSLLYVGHTFQERQLHLLQVFE